MPCSNPRSSHIASAVRTSWRRVFRDRACSSAERRGPLDGGRPADFVLRPVLAGTGAPAYRRREARHLKPDQRKVSVGLDQEASAGGSPAAHETSTEARSRMSDYK